MPNNCSNPMCNFKFDRRNPPPVCPKCHVLLGPVKPTKVKENRKPKKTVKVKNPKHVTVDLGDGLYSVQYHQHNRCVVKIVDGDNISFCDQKKCTENRRFAVRNNTQFECSHIQKVKQAVTDDDITPLAVTYDCEAVRGKIDVLPMNAKNEIVAYMSSVSDFLVMKISDWSYTVRTPPSNMRSQNLVHVSMKNQTSNFICANGNNCTRFRVKVSKKRTTTSLCPHEHIIMLLSGKNIENAETPASDSEPGNPCEEHKWLECTSRYLFETKKIDLSDANIMKLEEQIVERNKSRGWPKLYQSNFDLCPVCDGDLGLPVRHSGVETSQILTRDNFEDVTVLVQKCNTCCILFQPFDNCLVNIGDSLLVSTDIIFLMRSLVQTGSPLSTVAETLIENISYRNSALYGLQRSQKEWLCRLLTAGYLAMECLDANDEESQVCGLCGVIPEAVLGDGGEDVSCVLESWHLERSETDREGVFPASYTDTFLNNIKCFFVEALVYPRVHMGRRFKMNFTTVPPFITPSHRGPSVYNTELLKDTRFTDAKVLLGNQQLLMQLINTGELKMDKLNSYKAKELNQILHKIGVLKKDTKKLASNMAKCDTIVSLYKSVESGYSQCHHTGNRKKASGGWYNESCLHGCIIASKMLFLSESVRDCIDIKLSKKYNAPTNILDTPCTASSHLATRDYDMWKLWFGDREGCAQTPTLDKEPDIVSIPKLQFETRRPKGLVLPEVEDLSSHAHPKTGDADKFFLGDRFHEANYPHSSELCRYHDINNISELDAAKTSSQEVLNFTRNWRRLRSTCTQNGETHLLYNIIMDRSHNRRIVKRQAEDLKLVVVSRHPAYMHFSN